MVKAYVFPGQGSQSVGMIDDFVRESKVFSDRLEEASNLISMDLTSIVANGPTEVLNQTEITQPALLVASVAMYEYFLERGGPPADLLSGHSLGEYSALVVSGAMSFSDGVRVVHKRGRLMQEAVPKGEGLMAAVLGLDDEVVEQVCARIDGVVSPANFNSPGQVVIAGSSDAVAMAGDQCVEAGARRVVPLDVSVPSHCSLMNSAAQGLLDLLSQTEVQVPHTPVYQNVDAEPSSNPDEIRAKLAEQVRSPVLWSRCISSMIGVGAQEFFECGPGKVLSGLMRRIDRSVKSVALGDFGTFTTQVEKYK